MTVAPTALVSATSRSRNALSTAKPWALESSCTPTPRRFTRVPLRTRWPSEETRIERMPVRRRYELTLRPPALAFRLTL